MKKYIFGSVLLLVSLSLFSQELTVFYPLKLNTPQAQSYIKLMNRIGELAGVKFKMDDTLPASRAKAMLQNGSLDISFGASDLAYADVMADVLWVKDPLVTGNLKVVSLQPFPYKTNADLRGKAVMAIRESAPVEILMADKAIKYVEAPDGASAFRMLLAGRAEFLVIHEAVLANSFSADPTLNPKQFFVAETPFLTVNNYIWLSKKQASWLTKIEAAVKQLKDSGEFARIMSGK